MDRLHYSRKADETFTCNIYLIDSDGNTSELKQSINVDDPHVQDSIFNYPISISLDSTGVFAILFEFTSDTDVSNKNLVTYLEIDAPVFQDGCTGDVNFSVTPDLYPGFFPVGEHTVTYYAIYRDEDGDIVDQDSCSFNITVNACCETIGGNISGEQEVCSGTNSTTLTLESHQGLVLTWQDSTVGGNWNDIPTTDTVVSYTAMDLSVTTYFRAIVKDGDCDSEFSGEAVINVKSYIHSRRNHAGGKSIV